MVLVCVAIGLLFALFYAWQTSRIEIGAARPAAVAHSPRGIDLGGSAEASDEISASREPLTALGSSPSHHGGRCAGAWACARSCGGRVAS